MSNRIIALDVLENKIRAMGQGLKLEVLIGSDWEMFVFKQTASNLQRLVPGFNILKPKDPDIPFNQCKPYNDGFALENTTPVYECLGHITDFIRIGLKNMYSQVKKELPNETVFLRPYGSVKLSQSTLDKAPPEYQRLGCAPSYNAYNEDLDWMSIPPKSESLFRTSGFHLHFGMNYPLTLTDAAFLSRWMDWFGGLLSVCLLGGIDSPIRREMYGKAGEFRIPPHGLEYRVLSGVCLTSPWTMLFCSDLVRAGFKFGRYLLNNKARLDAPDLDVVQTAINTNDVKLARQHYKKYKTIYDLILINIYPYIQPPYITNVVMTGSSIWNLNPDNMDYYWKINRGVVEGEWGNHIDNDRRTFSQAALHPTSKTFNYA